MVLRKRLSGRMTERNWVDRAIFSLSWIVGTMLETKQAVMNKSHMINSSEKFTIKRILQKHFEKSLNINLSILYKAPITQGHLSQSTDFTLILKNFLPQNLFMYSTLIIFFPFTQLLPDSPHLTVHFVSCLKKKEKSKQTS